ncbi:MAG: cytochrome bd ubiquinol oxidase subunit [Paraburkholderia sp.]|uniref:cytochrome ubiquinol oxidase subunit I n=1 Tax=Paraburkholderia sp. TaxID=1926495 RepID=UPI002AFEC0C2|nr:cytochrome ubiquinol oxidase subunit I [Paraburkholderia sp.]MEA3085073.1 cytochrome bd ubiquinol oxidase subunit [Paraburkholderia sp.]
MDAAIQLARLQFGFTIGLHIVLAAFSIGLSSYLMVLEALWLWTHRQVYIDVYNYWLKLFALTFAAGAVSGIVMEYQFGTNWGPFALRTGAVIGPMMMYEIVVAFFLESGFLGIMLFGMKKVGPKLHFAATTLVAVGSLLSAFWILSANSWMQTPAGFRIGSDGRFVPLDWWAIVFNPSFPYRLVHMTLAAFLGAACFVGGTGAWHLLRDPVGRAARTMLSMAMWMVLIAAPLQLVAGDQHGENTLEHQPQKLAAMEGDWESRPAGSGEPMVLFAIPDMVERRNHYELAIPRVASLYLRHNLSGTIRGLKEFPPADIPPVPIVFFAFRVMVGLGLLMIAAGVAGLVLRCRRRLYDARWLHYGMVALTPAGFVAMLAGWTVTEVGRQPWTVYGMLRTAQSASPVGWPAVAWSMGGILFVYIAMFGFGLAYMLRLLARPPHEGEQGPHPSLVRRIRPHSQSAGAGSGQ